MAVPAKPVGGASIESAWGGLVHDTVVALDVQAGSGSATISAATFVDAQFPFARPFASAPLVVVSLATNTQNAYPVVAAVSATNVTIKFVARAGSAITQACVANWVAIGPRA